MMTSYSKMGLSNHSYELKSFNGLSSDHLYQILKLRCQVFVLEQDCAYQDLDGLDPDALHLYQTKKPNEIIAYARILTPQQNNGTHSSIGRVVVDQQHRKEKRGHALMQAAIDVTTQTYPAHPIKISAQTYLSHFYHQLGFINTGHYYLEDQIPHQEMIFQPIEP